MFVNFNKVFKNDPKTQFEIPPVFIENLNKNLPDGIQYEVDKDGDCTIVSTKKSITFGGIIIEPDEEDKKILGEHFSSDDIMDFYYNCQKPIPTKLKKDGFLLVDGKEMAIDEIKFNPLRNTKYVENTFEVWPSLFPPPFKISIGDGEIEKELTIKRIPNKSIHEALFESSKGEILSIKYRINSKENKMTMDLSFSLKQAQSVKEVVDSIRIYNAFINGNGYVMGNPLVGTLSSEETTFDEKSEVFWKKVLAIEEKLDVAFIPYKEKIDIDTMCLVEQLYQNLINKIPVKDTQALSSVESMWDFEKEDVNIMDEIGKPLFLELEVSTQTSLFGVDLELPTLLKVFNSMVSNIETNNKKHKIFLSDESKEKHRYTSIMCFASEEEMMVIKNMDFNERVEMFRNVKSPYEYF